MLIALNGGAGHVPATSAAICLREVGEQAWRSIICPLASTGRYRRAGRLSPAMPETNRAWARSSDAHRIDAIIHFTASIVVPDSVRDPLGHHCALIEAAVPLF